jgi:hypothetical protein
MAQHLVARHRFLEMEEDDSKRHHNPDRGPTSRSTRKSRLKMFGHTGTVQRVATKYDAAFLGLVISRELTNRDKQIGDPDTMKTADGWTEAGLTLYSEMVEGIGTMWRAFTDEDIIYPLTGGFDYEEYDDNDDESAGDSSINIFHEAHQGNDSGERELERI